MLSEEYWICLIILAVSVAYMIGVLLKIIPIVKFFFIEPLEDENEGQVLGSLYDDKKKGPSYIRATEYTGGSLYSEKMDNKQPLSPGADLQLPSEPRPQSHTELPAEPEAYVPVSYTSLPEPPASKVFRYVKKDLLAAKEYSFYIDLKQCIANKNLSVMCKVLLTDIVEPDSKMNKREWFSAFGKASQRSVDFLVVDSFNLSIICAIMFDDSETSTRIKRERDAFVNKLFEQAGITLLRVPGELKEVKAIIQNTR